jgi:hypothetical protein
MIQENRFWIGHERASALVEGQFTQGNRDLGGFRLREIDLLRAAMTANAVLRSGIKGVIDMSELRTKAAELAGKLMRKQATKDKLYQAVAEHQQAAKAFDDAVNKKIPPVDRRD